MVFRSPACTGDTEDAPGTGQGLCMCHHRLKSKIQLTNRISNQFWIQPVLIATSCCHFMLLLYNDKCDFRTSWKALGRLVLSPGKNRLISSAPRLCSDDIIQALNSFSGWCHVIPLKICNTDAVLCLVLRAHINDVSQGVSQTSKKWCAVQSHLPVFRFSWISPAGLVWHLPDLSKYFRVPEKDLGTIISPFVSLTSYCKDAFCHLHSFAGMSLL